MRKNLGAKLSCYPLPVYIIATYDKDGTPDAMNAGWGSPSGSNELFLCLNPGHQTTANLLARGAFTVSLATADQVVASDYVGLVSAKDCPDKLARAGWTCSKSDFVDAPLIDQLPLALECRVKSYDPESHHLFGEIVNVSAQEGILNEDGSVNIEKLQPLSLNAFQGTYLSVGQPLGKAFQEGKKLK